MIITYNYEYIKCRKAVLPIEIELQKEDHTAEPSDLDTDIDRIVCRMTEMRKKLFETAGANIKHAQAKYKEHYDEKRRNPQVYTRCSTCALNLYQKLTVGTKVWLKNSLRDSKKGNKTDDKWMGPYTISEDIGKSCYKLRNKC